MQWCGNSWSKKGTKYRYATSIEYLNSIRVSSQNARSLVADTKSVRKQYSQRKNVMGANVYAEEENKLKAKKEPTLEDEVVAKFAFEAHRTVKEVFHIIADLGYTITKTPAPPAAPES